MTGEDLPREEDLPDNVHFLTGAYQELQDLKTDPEAYRAVCRALASLGIDGPPSEARPFAIRRPDFPLGLAYRIDVKGRTIVFEPNPERRVNLRSSGREVVRYVGPQGDSYTIWCIIPLD